MTIDNSVYYIPRSEQTKKDIKPNTIKNRKQEKNISQNKEKFANDSAAKGFRILKGKMNCYF